MAQRSSGRIAQAARTKAAPARWTPNGKPLMSANDFDDVLKTKGDQMISLSQFIRDNRDELDAAIQSVVPGAAKNDEERRMWVLNDEGLYNWARNEGVRI